ncbi:MAG: hypothetical protein M1816_001165 [Peltula sp. TS41687]|nr:MAG: hypothetical protein M1816_001165 [Peltula sp. TS41687]
MASNQHTTFALNTGARIPAVGFGTWQVLDDTQEDAVLEALKVGYRHIDTARVYGTESAVGKAVKKSGVERSELFITTKLWHNKHHPDDVEGALDASLKDLGMDYVDLYLMHWPLAFERGDNLFPKDQEGKIKKAEVDYLDTYKAMAKLLKTGKTKAIGISNFSQTEIERLLEEVPDVVPAVHQLELHPWLQQRAFMAFHKQHDIHITQYSPFGNQNDFYKSTLGKLLDEPVLGDIGKKHNKSPAQVALAWAINQGHSVIPKSKTPQRIKANLEGDFKLDDEDMQQITTMDKKVRFCDDSKLFDHPFFVGLEGK